MFGGLGQALLASHQMQQRLQNQLMQQQYSAAQQQMAGMGGLQGFSVTQMQQEAYRPQVKALPKSIAAELQESVDKWLADVKI